VKFLEIGLTIKNADGAYIAGDWMLFSTSIRGLLNHSAIYLGNGEIIHSTEKAGVNIDKFNDIQIGDLVEAYEEVEVARKL
jgi:translation initiation factor IF-2